MNPYVAGGAVLGISLRAPSYDENGGCDLRRPVRRSTSPSSSATGPCATSCSAAASRATRTFAVGVRATLPFRVFVLAGPGTHSRIVLDVAHTW